MYIQLRLHVFFFSPKQFVTVWSLWLTQEKEKNHIAHELELLGFHMWYINFAFFVTMLYTKVSERFISIFYSMYAIGSVKEMQI